MFDSVTRFAKAQREIGLSTGESPATRGYPPSVFSLLPRLLERAGTGAVGSITGLYTVLVDGDDMDEPIADAVRGILDGHLVLSRKLAERYHYPAIDVLASVSRLANKVCTREMRGATGELRKLMATYAENEDLINVGAYASGTHPEIDTAIKKQPAIRGFLQQDVDELSNLAETWKTASIISGVVLPIDQAENLEKRSVSLLERRTELYGERDPVVETEGNGDPVRASLPAEILAIRRREADLNREFQDPDEPVIEFIDENEFAEEIAAISRIRSHGSMLSTIGGDKG